MYTKPDHEQAKAIARLRSPEFAPLLAFLAKENGHVISNLIGQPDPVNIHRLQGRAQFIHDFLSLVQVVEK